MVLDAEPHFAAPFQQDRSVMVSRHDTTFAGATKCRKVFQDLSASGVFVFERQLVTFLPVTEVREYLIILFFQHYPFCRSANLLTLPDIAISTAS